MAEIKNSETEAHIKNLECLQKVVKKTKRKLHGNCLITKSQNVNTLTNHEPIDENIMKKRFDHSLLSSRNPDFWITYHGFFVSKLDFFRPWVLNHFECYYISTICRLILDLSSQQCNKYFCITKNYIYGVICWIGNAGILFWRINLFQI